MNTGFPRIRTHGCETAILVSSPNSPNELVSQLSPEGRHFCWRAFRNKTPRGVREYEICHLLNPLYCFFVIYVHFIH